MEIKIIEDEELRFIANIEGGDVELRYSNSEIWTSHTKGTNIGELKDTGNNIKINLNGKKIKLGYDEFNEMLIIMNLKQKYDEQLHVEQTWVK